MPLHLKSRAARYGTPDKAYVVVTLGPGGGPALRPWKMFDTLEEAIHFAENEMLGYAEIWVYEPTRKWAGGNWSTDMRKE